MGDPNDTFTFLSSSFGGSINWMMMMNPFSCCCQLLWCLSVFRFVWQLNVLACHGKLENAKKNAKKVPKIGKKTRKQLKKR
jgi:hypothetical protein